MDGGSHFFKSGLVKGDLVAQSGVFRSLFGIMERTL
jgi:hypothetical protein